ncbi:hypothetical protein [Dactylosporangium sp. CA-092794]|uniref:hypothetical protein n=1 Tax=Dactylosporangium sp. CA-092794 TaxID=3239929 RepID=UPI003D93C3F1
MRTHRRAVAAPVATGVNAARELYRHPTKTTPTASGDVEVRCTKPANHPDPQHEAKLGAFPIRWW